MLITILTLDISTGCHYRNSSRKNTKYMAKSTDFVPINIIKYMKQIKKLLQNLANSNLMTTFALARSGFGAVGSAHVWGARGRWFESSNPD